MRLLAGFALFSLLATPAAGQLSRASLTLGKADTVKSTVLGENRTILVYTPPSYSDTVYTPRRYPVLYLLDGDAHFRSVSGLIHILATGINGTFVVPEMIVVAIPNTDRTRDLTPTHVETGFDGKPAPFLKTSGGNAKFFEFMRTELFPRIERDYRTAPYRVLVGHSFGGITAINALYTVPEMFNAYVAIDPSLWYDNQTLLRQAKGRFSRPGLEGKALFVGQANTINPDDTTSNTHFQAIMQFNMVMEQYNKSGLRYAYKYYPDDDHGSVPMIAEYDALRFLFAPYRVKLGAALERPEYLAEHFRQVSDLLGYPVTPPESMVDLVGQVAMSQDTAKGIGLFELNTRLYPRSAHAWNSLGRGLAAKADTAGALAAHRHALEADAGNRQAREAIDKLSRRR